MKIDNLVPSDDRSDAAEQLAVILIRTRLYEFYGIGHILPSGQRLLWLSGGKDFLAEFVLL